MNIRSVILIERPVRIIFDCVFDSTKQILIINNITEILFVAIHSVHATNRLKQVVVTHLFVDIQVGSRRRIESGEQFIHDDQQFHICRMLYEFLLRPRFELFGRAVADHSFVDFVFGKIFRFAFADVFVLY